MFESILANILNRILGKYIDNLEYNQLKLGIWSGDVGLNNLKLRTDALDDLQLPIEIVEGYLGEFTMKIPWQALKTQAVQVNIHKLYLLVVPNSEVKFDEAVEKERAHKRKMESLAAAELFGASTEIYQDDTKSQSFFDQLVTKIIDNLQINVESIHVRYEDKISNPETPFSIGFTLGKVSAVSTDAQWFETFVHDAVSSVYKLLKLNGLAIYQNTKENFTPFTREIGVDFFSSFELLIPELDGPGNTSLDTPGPGNRSGPETMPLAKFASARDHQYLLKPVSGHGKLTLHKALKTLVRKYLRPSNFLKSFENVVAKNSLHVDFDDLSFSLDNEQYQAILKMLQMFNRYYQIKKFSSLRPSTVTCEEDPKAWFQYAVKASLLDIREMNKKWTWNFIKGRIEKKRIYETIYYIKMRPKLLAGLITTFEPLSNDQKRQLEDLEYELNYEDLLYFRSNVLKKLELESKELKALQGHGSEAPAVVSWFSTVWNWTTSSKATSPSVTMAPDIFLHEEETLKAEEPRRLNQDDMNRLLDTIDYHEDSDSLLDASTMQSSTENLLSPSGLFTTSKSSPMKTIYYFVSTILTCNVKEASVHLCKKGEQNSLLNIMFKDVQGGYMEQNLLAKEKQNTFISENNKGINRVGKNIFVKLKSLKVDEVISRNSLFKDLASSEAADESLTDADQRLGNTEKALAQSGEGLSDADISPREGHLFTAVHLIHPFYDPELSFHTEVTMEPIVILLNNIIHENIMSFFKVNLSDDMHFERTQLLNRAVERFEDLKSFTSAHLQYLLDKRVKSFVQVRLHGPTIYVPIKVDTELVSPMFVINLGVFELATTSKDQSLSSMEDLFQSADDTILDLPSTYLSKELLESAYEAYACTLTNFSVQFYSRSKLFFDKALTSTSESSGYKTQCTDANDFRVIEPATLQLLLKPCIVSNDISLPQMKIFVKSLHPIQVHLSDLSYQTLMLLMDIFLPTTEKDLVSILNKALKESKELCRSNLLQLPKGSDKRGTSSGTDTSKGTSIRSLEAALHVASLDDGDEDEYFDAESDVNLDLESSTVIHIQSPKGRQICETISDLQQGKEMEYFLANRSPSPLDEVEALRRVTERRRFHLFTEIEDFSITLYQSGLLAQEHASPWQHLSASLPSHDDSRFQVAKVKIQDFSLCMVKRDLDLAILLQVSSINLPLYKAIEDMSSLSQSFCYYNPFTFAEKILPRLDQLVDIIQGDEFPLLQSHGTENVFCLKLVKCLPIHPQFESRFQGLQYKATVNLSELSLCIQPDIFTNFFFYIQATFAQESRHVAQYRKEQMTAPLPWMPTPTEEPFHVESTVNIQKVNVFLLKSERKVIGKMNIGNGMVIAWNAFQNDWEQDKKITTAKIGQLTIDTFSSVLSVTSSEDPSSAASDTNGTLSIERLLYFVDDSNAIELNIESFTKEQFLQEFQRLHLEAPLNATSHSLLKVTAASMLIYFYPWYLKWVYDWLNNILMGVESAYKELDAKPFVNEPSEATAQVAVCPQAPVPLHCAHFRIDMETPVLLFSRPEHVSSRDQCLVFHLGKISVSNRFALDFYYISMRLDYLAMFSIHVQEMLNYHPIYAKKATLLDPCQLQVDFTIANQVPAKTDRLAMTEAIVVFIDKRTVAEMDSRRLYLFFERFFWVLGQCTLLTAVSEEFPVMDQATHAFELVLKMPYGLSVQVMTNQDKQFCQVSLLNLDIFFITKGDNSTQLIIEADALSIITPEGKELFSPFTTDSSCEKQVSMVFDMNPNFDSMLKLVLVKLKLALDLRLLLGLYNFYFEGFPGPADTPEIIAPENTTNWVSVKIHQFEGFIQVTNDVHLVVAIETLDFGSKFGHNQLVQIDNFSLRLFMTEHSDDIVGAFDDTGFTLDLIDPFHFYLTSSYEPLVKTVTKEPLEPLKKPPSFASKSEISLSSVLAKFSYQDLLMLQQVSSKLQQDMLHLPEFHREKPILESLPFIIDFNETTFSCPSLRLLLIDDASAVYIPIFDIYLKELSGGLLITNGSAAATNASFKTNLLVNYMNMNNSMWEPLLEPWQFHLDYEQKFEQSRVPFLLEDRGGGASVSEDRTVSISDGSLLEDRSVCTNIKLTSDTRANLNVTKNFLNYYSHIQSVLSNSGPFNATRKRMQKEPYRIVNESGCELRIWKSTTADDPDVQVLKLSNGETMPLSFENWKDTRKGLHPALHSVGIHFLRQDKVHLLSNDEAFLQWESTKVIPVYKEGIQCISHEPLLLEEYENYAKNTGSNLKVPKHQYIVQVSLELDNQKEIRIKSPMLFENTSLNLDIEIGTLFKGSLISWKVKAGTRVGLPPLLAYWHHWRIRPLGLNSEELPFEWSKETFAWKDFTCHPLQELEFSCHPSNQTTTDASARPTSETAVPKASHKPALNMPGTFYCHMYAVSQVPNTLNKDFPCLVVRFLPPFRLNNLLPFKLYYKMMDKQAKSSITGQLGPYNVADATLNNSLPWSVDLWSLPSQHLIGIAVHVVYGESNDSPYLESQPPGSRPPEALEYILYKSKDVAVVHTGDAARIRKSTNNSIRSPDVFNLNLSRTLEDLGDETLECIIEETGESFNLSMAYEFLDWDERLHSLCYSYPNVEGYWSKGLNIYCPYIVWNQTGLPINIKQHSLFSGSLSSSSGGGGGPSSGGSSAATTRSSVAMANTGANTRFVRDQKILMGASQSLDAFDSTMNRALYEANAQLPNDPNIWGKLDAKLPKLFSYLSGIMLKNRAMLAVLPSRYARSPRGPGAPRSLKSPRDSTCTLGTTLGSEWSKALSLEAIGSCQEIILKCHPEANPNPSNEFTFKAYNLSLSIEPAMFLHPKTGKSCLRSNHACKMIRLRVKYCLLNSTSNVLYIRNAYHSMEKPMALYPSTQLVPFHLDYETVIPKSSKRIPLDQEDWFLAKDYLKGFHIRIATSTFDGLIWSPPLDITQVGTFYFLCKDDTVMKLKVTLQDHLIIAQFEHPGTHSVETSSEHFRTQSMEHVGTHYVGTGTGTGTGTGIGTGATNLNLGPATTPSPGPVEAPLAEAPLYLRNETRFNLVVHQKYTSPMHRRVYKLKGHDPERSLSEASTDRSPSIRPSSRVQGGPKFVPFYWDLPCLLQQGTTSSRRKIVLSMMIQDSSTLMTLAPELDVTQVGTMVVKPIKVDVPGSSSSGGGGVVEVTMDVTAENLSLYVTFYEVNHESAMRNVEPLDAHSLSIKDSLRVTQTVKRRDTGHRRNKDVPPLRGNAFDTVRQGPASILVASSYSVELVLPEIGISFIQDDSTTVSHYEILYCYLNNLLLSYRSSKGFTTFGILLRWLQCDNQTRATEDSILLYPTLLNAPYSLKKEKQREREKERDKQGEPPKEDLPFIKIGVIFKNDSPTTDSSSGSGSGSSGVQCVPYAGALIQEFTLELDEEYLYTLIDFFTPSRTNSRYFHMATRYDTYFAKESDSTAKPTVHEQLFYFEVFQLHPIKVNLTFTRIEELLASSDPLSAGGASSSASSQLGLRSHIAGPVGFLIDVLSISLGNIHDAPLKFNSLLLQHPILPMSLLVTMVSEHISQQGLSQLHRFIGSADFLGNPIGLFNCFAEGVSDLFYEPYLGFVSDRPQDFGIGIAKGGASLLKNTVYGVSDTLTKFTESLSKGLSLTTLDKDFQRQRIQNRRKNTPKHALSGVGLGARTLITSVASGITGIVTRPIEAVREEGPAGLWKGLGRGVIGVITKPVLGVVDMASQVTQGIRNTTTLLEDSDDSGSLEKIRLPRTLYYDHVLRPYSPLEAMGQYCLMECAKGNVIRVLANAIRAPVRPPVYYMTHLPLSPTEWLVLSTAGLVFLSPLDLSASATASATTTTTNTTTATLASSSTTTSSSNYLVIPFSSLAKLFKGMDYIRLDIYSSTDHHHHHRHHQHHQNQHQQHQPFSSQSFDKKIIMLQNEPQKDWLLHKIELARAVYKQLYK